MPYAMLLSNCTKGPFLTCEIAISELLGTIHLKV